MHTVKYFFGLFLLLVCIDAAFSQKLVVELPGTQVLKFKSVINNQDYVLDIELPDSYNIAHFFHWLCHEKGDRFLDTIFLQPVIKELPPVTISQKKIYFNSNLRNKIKN